MLASLALGANKGLLKLVDGNTDNNMNNNGGMMLLFTGRLTLLWLVFHRGILINLL